LSEVFRIKTELKKGYFHFFAPPKKRNKKRRAFWKAFFHSLRFMKNQPVLSKFLTGIQKFLTTKQPYAAQKDTSREPVSIASKGLFALVF
jgi:hypothetical protein